MTSTTYRVINARPARPHRAHRLGLVLGFPLWVLAAFWVMLAAAVHEWPAVAPAFVYAGLCVAAALLVYVLVRAVAWAFG